MSVPIKLKFVIGYFALHSALSAETLIWFPFSEVSDWRP